MDTSKEYISMCEKATEIQELEPAGFNIHSETGVWLPRQDELQAVLNKGLSDRINKAEINLAFFSSEVQPRNNKEQYRQYQRFTTFEQLWLAFVMKIAYSKIWNSEKEEWELIG